VHDNENLQGVFLHILADALGSVAVIISSIAIEYGGFYIADPICCFIISILILMSVIPLIKSTFRVLSLTQSGILVKKLEQRLPNVNLSHKYSIKILELHVWELAAAQMVCTVKINVQQVEET
jgi:zinc transporter 5/7